MNENEKMSEAWRRLADRFKGAANRTEADTALQLAYLVLAQHCTREVSDVRGPTMEMVSLAEYVTGEHLEAAFDAALVNSTVTTVDLVIRIQVVGAPADVENYRDALDCLAEVMATQAEDGLWQLGHPDAECDGIQNEQVANILATRVQTILIEGIDELTKEAP